jgi:5-methylcytosine-specific restriction endonuclease McrA
MTRPHEFADKVKLARFHHAGGRCESCSLKIIGVAEYDHEIPIGLGGESTLENCRCLCGKCHRLKTSSQDVPAIAKAKRRERAAAGARTSKKPMPHGRRSSTKRLFDGTVVDRRTGRPISRT